MFRSKSPTLIFVFLITLFFVNPELLKSQVETQAPFDVYRLNEGTEIHLRMDNEINSRSSTAGDTFTAEVEKPVVVKKVVVLPAGAIVEGTIVRAKEASAGGKNGVLELLFEKITLADGTRIAIAAVLAEETKLEPSTRANTLAILGGTVVGAFVGALTKNSKAVLIGAGIGAGTGTGVAFLRKGKEVRIRAKEVFEIKLTKSVTFPSRGF